MDIEDHRPCEICGYPTPIAINRKYCNACSGLRTPLLKKERNRIKAHRPKRFPTEEALRAYIMELRFGSTDENKLDRAYRRITNKYNMENTEREDTDTAKIAASVMNAEAEKLVVLKPLRTLHTTDKRHDRKTFAQDRCDKRHRYHKWKIKYESPDGSEATRHYQKCVRCGITKK